MIVDVPPAFVLHFLEEGGMPAALCQQCQLEPVEEGALAITFKITSLQGVFYLKLHEQEGARGGPFLKHLLPIHDLEMREHAEKRRHFVRKMLDSVIAQRSTLIPQPCYFDLRPFPMALQKLRKTNEHVTAELRMEGENCPPRLEGLVGTIWKEMNIGHIPVLSPEKKDVWNPIDYSPENVFRCTAAIGELQEKSEKFLEAVIEKKVHAGMDSRGQIRERFRQKLQHEQRALQGYETLTTEFFCSLGLKEKDGKDLETSLKALGARLLEDIQSRLMQRGGSSLQELKTQFLASVAIPPEYAHLAFQKIIYFAESEKWWTPAKRDEGKAFVQIEQAESMAMELCQDPSRFATLIRDLQEFKQTYRRLEQLSQTMVPQDAHPFNLFIHQEDGATTMLDLEDISMGVRFADLSTVYLFKICRAVIENKITRDTALEYMRAVLDGYNSTATSPLAEEELELMADYAIGVFFNFLPQFGIILRMDPKELSGYNLAMSSDSFMQHFQLLQQISKEWREMLFLLRRF